MVWHHFATMLLAILCFRHACQGSGLGGSGGGGGTEAGSGSGTPKAPEPEPVPLPPCPAFANSARTNGVPDELAHACTCEITEGTGCRGITPRFNWIIASCDRPDGVPGVGGTDNARFPGPPGSAQCADPMRLRPDDNNASVVQLRYIAAYQWGEPCEVILAALCPYSELRQGAACTACTRAHHTELLAGGCSAPQLAEACDPCGIAMRNATWIDHEPGKPPAPRELCVELGAQECRACLGQNQEKLLGAQCEEDRLEKFCQQRNWTMDTASSVNTRGALPVLNLSSLEQPGGASMWNRGAYMPRVRGLGPPGMLFAISCRRCSSFAWYLLNQGTLDRGPDKSTCANRGGGTDNCWGSASAGELDLLETGFWDPAFYNTSRPDSVPNPNRNNSRHYLTSFAGAGRCLPVNKGMKNPQDTLKAAHGAGGSCSNSYFVDDGQPHLYAAVVDRRGVTVYRDPVWDGLAPATAQAVLGAHAPTQQPQKLGAPCEVGDGSCAANTPACLMRHPPPEGQPDCRQSVTPPEQEEGYEKCTQLADTASSRPSHSEGQLRPSPRLSEDTTHRSKQGSISPSQDPSATVERGVFLPPMSCCHARLAAAPGYNYSCVNDTTVKPQQPGQRGFDGRVCRDPNCDKGTDQDSCTAQTWSYDPHKSCVWDPADRCNLASRDGADYWGCCGTNPVASDRCPFECEGVGPPPPPADPVYCCNCTAASSCLQSRRNKQDTYCTDPSATCVPWKPGEKCPSGQGSTSKHECEEHCNPPPYPTCSSETNWWDLFADTGQWAVDEADCDQSTCPYPVGAGDSCDPHPFYCCNPATQRCEVWNGEDQAHTCPAGPFTGWDGQSRCQDSC
jgi:hypothetical protein